MKKQGKRNDFEKEANSSRTTTVLSSFPSTTFVIANHKVNTRAVSILVTFQQFSNRITLFWVERYAAV